MNLTPLQTGILAVLIIYAGGFGWHFLARPQLAKRIGLFALPATVSVMVWYFAQLPEMPPGDLIIRVAHALVIPLITLIPLVISLWIGGLCSARWLVQKFHPRSDPASGE